MEISYKDQEVHNHLARVVIAIGIVTIGIPMVIVTLPVSIPLHFLLKKVGRKGFFREKRIVFDTSSFSRV